ncbi:hypothetical protein EV121DRAFT_208045 [Schizophyllum commune]
MSALETYLCAKYGDTPSSSCQPPSFDLLRFGYTLSADELGELRQDITSLDASLAVIDAADTGTSNNARLASLQRYRAQLAECKARKQALATPIFRLPPELLMLIIHAALPPTWTTAAAGATRFPLLETCFRIRRTALAMPELWSTIVMKAFNGKKAIDRFYVVAQLYMDRIKPHPVDIIAKCALFDSQYNRWVIAHMDRIRSIDWYLKVDAIYGSHISAPLLESATLSAYNTQQYSPFRILTFSHAPLLTKLRINAAAPSCFDIPWAQLESLTIKNMALSLYDLRILQLCTSLRTLKVCILPIYYVPQHGVTPIHIPGMTFPSLRVLRLSRYGHRLAAFIDAPNLVEITVAARASFLRIDSGHYSLLRSSVRSLLTRDLYSLRTLSLKGFLCSHRDGDLGDLVSILHLVPQLERLRLAYELFALCDLALPQRLVAPHSGWHLLLPNLAHLALEYDDIAPDFEFGDVLKELVLSRWGADGAESRECMSVRSRNCRGGVYCECLGLYNWIAGVKGKGIFVNSRMCKSPVL